VTLLLSGHPFLPMTNSFQVVYIPADTDLPTTEWTITYKDGEEVPCLFDRIKAHFAETQKGVKLNESEKKRQKEQLQEKAKGTQVPDEFLDRMLSMNFVGSTALLNPIKDTEYMAINLYTDDQGLMKNLPHNVRASAVAQEVGKPMQVLGDAWIARYRDDGQDLFQRMDFTVGDLRSDAEWMKKAKALGMQSIGRDTKQEMQKLMDAASKKSALKQCAMGFHGCETPTKFRCSRCQNMWYCSQDHQRKDWSRHKLECTKKETS